MVFVLMVAANTFDLLNSFFPSLQSREIRWLIRRDSAFVVGVGVVTYLLNQVWWISTFFLTLVAILVLIDFYIAPKFVKTAATYRDRLQDYAGRLWNRPAEVTFVQRFDRRVGQRLLISSVLLLAGAVLGGYRYASTQEEFLMIGNCAVLRVRENYALCAELNSDKPTGTFHTFAVDDLKLTRAETGPIERYKREPQLPGE
jgi:uncharacterized membrane protein